MGRSLTNNFSIQYAIEETIGVLPAQPDWKLLEPNAINTFGATITTVPRSPISKDRQRRKGAVTDLDSAVEFDADLTLDSFIDFIEGFCFANFSGPIATAPTATSTSAYTVPAMDAAVDVGTLLVARGFLNADNNGLKIADAAGTTTSVPVVETLIAETPASTRNCTLEVAGFRFAAGDAEIDVDGNIITTLKDMTEFGLVAGQAVHIGGEVAANRFALAANYSYARAVVITAHKITLDKKLTTFAIDDGATKEVDILFGRFCKNVSVDDGNFVEKSFHFEGAYQGLGDTSADDEYEYAKGNFCNTVGFDLPLTDKAAVGFAFIGTDTDPIVEEGDRAQNADTPRIPVQTTAFNTSADIARLRITELDETGLTTDFKSITLNINNNVTPEKVLGLLGAKYMNTGNFEIDFESQLLFTDKRVVAAIRANETLTLDFSLKNDNGAIFVDIPALTLGGGDREYPVNESILVNTTAQAFGDPLFNASLQVSLFPYPPAAA